MFSYKLKKKNCLVKTPKVIVSASTIKKYPFIQGILNLEEEQAFGSGGKSPHKYTHRKVPLRTTVMSFVLGCIGTSKKKENASSVWTALELSLALRRN